MDDPLFPRHAISPDQDAIVVPAAGRLGPRPYRRISFAALQEDVIRCAAGLQTIGVRKGMRLVLLVPFGPDFIALVFAILKAGAQVVLVDPGLGLRNMLQCLAEVRPDGFIAVPQAHLFRWWKQALFPQSRIHIVVGSRWPGLKLRELRQTPLELFQQPTCHSDDPAAIIFTSGSTGPAKGVQFTRGNFAAQVQQIQQRYRIPPGGVDLACFPLFGLFNATMGVTTVIPPMNPSRPASADPAQLVRIIRELEIDQSFASPVIWDRIGRSCARTQTKMPSLRRVFSAGAPVAPRVLQQLQDALPADAHVATPYGATEALPLATIDSSEVLADTAAKTAKGAGICVGSRFADVQWRIIEITDNPIETMDQARMLETGEIGEIVVAGPQVTTHYVTRVEANALHKIHDGDTIWHRLGDVGYFDALERFWFCGRKAHRVQTESGTMYSICCEAIFNEHPRIYRSALVGIGPPGCHQPIIVCEPWQESWPRRRTDYQRTQAELANLAQLNPRTARIGLEQILLKRTLPVDARHNAKILREELIPWVARTKK